MQHAPSPDDASRSHGRYVKMSGNLTVLTRYSVWGPPEVGVWAVEFHMAKAHVPVTVTAREPLADVSGRFEKRGRLHYEPTFASPHSPAWAIFLDATASRFHPASIAGLVVGAMGVFVFTVALRHWLGERRAAREAA